VSKWLTCEATGRDSVGYELQDDVNWLAMCRALKSCNNVHTISRVCGCRCVCVYQKRVCSKVREQGGISAFEVAGESIDNANSVCHSGGPVEEFSIGHPSGDCRNFFKMPGVAFNEIF
jgi:hypothetical protein